MLYREVAEETETGFNLLCELTAENPTLDALYKLGNYFSQLRKLPKPIQLIVDTRKAPVLKYVKYLPIFVTAIITLGTGSVRKVAVITNVHWAKHVLQPVVQLCNASNVVLNIVYLWD